MVAYFSYSESTIATALKKIIDVVQTSRWYLRYDHGLWQDCSSIVVQQTDITNPNTGKCIDNIVDDITTLF